MTTVLSFLLVVLVAVVPLIDLFLNFGALSINFLHYITATIA